MSIDEVVPPFLSPRIAAKAREVLAYAGLTGFAFLVSPRGEAGPRSGARLPLDVHSAAFLVSARNWTYDGDEVVSFTHPGCAAVHAAQVAMGWVLCVVSTVCVPSAAVVGRLRRARDVLELGFLSAGSPAGGVGGGSGPVPAHVAVFAPSAHPRSRT